MALRHNLLPWLLFFFSVPSIAENTQEIPSLELLEYLAEFAESEQGTLIDPMNQQYTNSKSYRNYIKEQTE